MVEAPATGRLLAGQESLKVLIVDLNNFASFPTLAIGILVASLRNAGHQVRLISPLVFDVPAAHREKQETYLDHLKRRIHLTDFQPVLGARDILRDIRTGFRERPDGRVLREVRNALSDKPDVILLSAYLQHFESVREISALAHAAGVPVLVGGPMFNVENVSDAWSKLKGVVGVVGAEVDMVLPAMVAAVKKGERLDGFSGVTMPDGSRTAKAPPLRNLDDTPLPDYTDFPWDRYPVRIVPLMAGRGCQWDKCLFCSDVISTSGRTFRTRSVDNVLLEMQEQARRHGTSSFLFLDLKLNSYPDMMRGIAESIRDYVRGAEWIGTVHVDKRKDNGLSRADLRMAVQGGMRRISFGLESGSQRLLDLMNKGSDVEGNSEFIRNAHDAGLSIRCTMFKGYPGETADDMEKTAVFLERHSDYLDRVRFNDFSLLQGTPIYTAVMEKMDHSGLSITRAIDAKARASYRNPLLADPAYRRAKNRVLAAVYAINRRPIRDTARQFDGLM